MCRRYAVAQKARVQPACRSRAVMCRFPWFEERGGSAEQVSAGRRRAQNVLGPTIVAAFIRASLASLSHSKMPEQQKGFIRRCDLLVSTSRASESRHQHIAVKAAPLVFGERGTRDVADRRRFHQGDAGTAKPGSHEAGAEDPR
jgi:hypothetical protein